ncbi:ER lumen protein retaining receptor [Gregarina niphandrodes]|uniref:ER lumen protein retaining receptor n=1 Tax=Gregarina niphandrodes TaxID=110365 RepID=A0A023BAM2_GRENI|nr:ER lumen protein retaining receptor [Gregarina niphandrodes]EZG78368.1 ER lumen protein retaining receptor [Gregarina niphandrodes]|eukprot:XP_011129323.1 ER lumen protein retaining receptor [Gregarina niphandrodes]
MNVFRLCGDMLHLASILLLLYKLRSSRSCSGISCKMQEMYLIVFGTRYLDLLYSFVSVYNTSMKVIFITSTAYIIYLMRFKPPISETYDKQGDRFPYLKFLLPPCVLLALLTPDSYHPTEVLWTFSIWFEAVAILPQLTLLQKNRVVENLTSHYVVAMGLYRLFYIVNWVYRYYTEGFVNYIGWIGGTIQVALYLDFFYYYYLA